MLASRQTIIELIEQGVIKDADVNAAGPVSYDLATEAFFTDAESYGKKSATSVLNPGDSVFVSSKETIALPNDLACVVLLKNSRIRQGLRLDAPLYFPGHETRVYFRVTNVSGSEITLGAEKGIAQIAFERLDRPTDVPYEGTFSDEFSFAGMGNYASSYQDEIKQLEKKAGDLESIEKRIYGNVMSIMAIIAAVFTLANLNFGLSGSGSVRQVLAINLATVGSFSLLAGLIGLAVQPKSNYAKVVPWALAAVAFVVAIILALLLPE